MRHLRFYVTCLLKFCNKNTVKPTHNFKFFTPGDATGDASEATGDGPCNATGDASEATGDGPCEATGNAPGETTATHRRSYR